MTVWATSNTVLNDSQSFTKVKSFAIPNTLVGLKASSPYDFFVNNINMNWAVQPFGGELGDQLISDTQGKLNFIWFFEQQYFHGYVVNGLNNVNTYLTLELRGKDNISSFYYLPLNLRGSK
jgi:hypothetical protein